MNDLSGQLKARRLRHGLTQEEVASALGVSPQNTKKVARLPGERRAEQLFSRFSHVKIAAYPRYTA